MESNHIENIAEGASRQPGFIKGFVYGGLLTLTITGVVTFGIGSVFLKDFSLNNLFTYISENTQYKMQIQNFQEKLKNQNKEIALLSSKEHDILIENKNLKFKLNKLQKVKEMIAKYKSKHGEIDITYSNEYSTGENHNKYVFATYSYETIKEFIIMNKLKNDFYYFIENTNKKLYGNRKT
jgi:hypothetical protein